MKQRPARSPARRSPTWLVLGGWCLCALAACSGLGGLQAKNQCASTADCSPGNVCQAGVCARPVDAGGPSSTDDGGSYVDRATETHETDALAPEAAPPDALAPEAVPSPCDVHEPEGGPLATLELAKRMVGTWIVCGSAPPADLSWLTGPLGRLQIGTTTWFAGDDGTAASGVYYLLLEGQGNVAHFAGGGVGADLAVTVSSSSRFITLTRCDGVMACNGTPMRLVAAARPAPDAGPADAGGDHASPP